MKIQLASWLACLAAPCLAQTATPASAPAGGLRPGWTVIDEAPARGERPEPNVQHAVTEDQGSKIDELRVRGQTRYIVVTPKVGTTRPYQILVNTDGHATFEGTGGPAGATGKRVWNVLDF